MKEATLSEEETRAIAKSQFKEAIETIGVTCGCGHRLPLRFSYRCYYCGVYFCDRCAAVHFGETREERKARLEPESKEKRGTKIPNA